MTKTIREGYTIRVEIPKECGYKGYWARCTYKYIKSKEKYQLSMWLMHEGIDDTFKIDAQEIDTQLVNCTRDNIENNIVQLVHKMALENKFISYIESYEYVYKCFNRGNELYDEERLSKNSFGGVS